MMQVEAKTEVELRAEVAALRQRVAELEALVAESRQAVRRSEIEEFQPTDQDISEQKQAEEKIRQRTALLEALQQIEVAFITEFDLDTLLETIVDQAIKLLAATMGSIHLYRPEQDVLEVAVMSHNCMPGLRGSVLQRGEGLSGKVWETGQPLVIDDYQKWPHRTAVFKGVLLTTVMGVPIQWGQEFLGVLTVSNRPEPFSTAEVELLTLFATQAATAIRNARLISSLQASEKRYRSLFEDSPVSLWEEDFSQVKACLDQLRAEGIEDFALYFERHPEVVHQCVSLIRLIDVNQAACKLCRVKDKAELLSLSYKIIEAAFESFKAELLAVVNGKTRFESEHVTRSVMGSGLYVMVSWSVVPGYEESYARVLVCVVDITERKEAEQALRAGEQQQRELAQQNALLYAETQRRLKEQTALLEATSVISAMPDLPTVLTRVIEQVGRIIDATSAFISNYNSDTKTSTVLAEYFSPHARVAEAVSCLGTTYYLPHDLPETFTFVQSDELSHTQHVADPNLPEIEKVAMQQYEVCTILTLRLQIGGKLIGFTTLRENRQQRRFTIEEVALCQGIAQYAAVAIENARLLEQARQDAETKAVLLKEVNHRVKNNLATIIGLLYAERRHRVSRDDESTFEVIIQDLIYRVQGLATVHSMLSATEWSPLSLSELARQVIASTLQSLPPDKHISVEVASSPVLVTPQQANNLALIINELTTNTIKYALPEREVARITVCIDRDGNSIIFEFKNDGPGYSERVLSLELRNVGIYLIQNIVRMGLRGRMILHNDSGAVTTICFPASVE
jgi:two-component sensor histidine kinase